MRVYEFAKKVGVSNKDILELLSKKKIEVASHMSALTDEALRFLEEKFSPTVQKDPTKKTSTQNKATQKTAGKKASSQQSAKRSSFSQKSKNQEKKEEKPSQVRQGVVVAEPAPLSRVAQQVGVPPSEVILYLLRKGSVCAINQVLTEEVVIDIAGHFQADVVFPEDSKKDILSRTDKEAGGVERLPVVVVLGHVDHGKTTLLDEIRKTRVVAKEKGGITQHLGAYKAHTKQGDIVFLDTPGHEAFSKMRARGARAADIAILVVAADDSIKPQTVEAIKHIKDLELPVIVAINKIDKVDPSRVDIVRRDLAQYDLLPEEWGGQTVSVPISALKNQGLDQLLEMVILQSELLELQADPDRPASGFILESKMERGRGAVATIICQQGTLHVGDYFAAGHTQGKISSLVDSAGKFCKKVGPSVPVLAAGFDDLPDAGDFFEVVSKEKYRELKSSKGSDRIRQMQQFAPTDEEALNLIIKTDTQSTKEALLGSIDKLSSKFSRPLRMVHVGVGDITESDVTLAADTGSRIIGLHIKIESNAQRLAQQNLVVVRLFDIIYKFLEHLEAIAQKEHKAEKVIKKTGQAKVLQTFQVKSLGTIAGAIVNQGTFSKDGRVKIFRSGELVGEGPIKSLQRERKTVKEVHEGFDCGFLVDGFNEWEVDDVVECYREIVE